MSTGSHSHPAPHPDKGKGLRVAFAAVAAIFAVCVGVQVLFAGLAIFADAANWKLHTTFVHLIEAIPLVMLALAFAGKLPAAARWESFGLFFMIILMYFTANVAAVMPVVSALHPVIALAMFALALRLAISSRKSR